MNALTPAQLTLGVRLQDDARFDNFVTGSNRAAKVSVQSLVSASPLDNFIYLWGAKGAGCSHLLQACYQASCAQGEQAFYLSLAEVVDYGPEVFDALESMTLLCLDDLQLIAGHRDWEQGLFHLFNRLRDQGKRLLVGVDCSPAQLAIELPDLLSRLHSGLCFQVFPLSDEEKSQALQHRAQGRGFELNEEAAKYILSRHNRNMAELFQALDTLDQASLSAKRKVTIPFIKSVFGW